MAVGEKVKSIIAEQVGVKKEEVTDQAKFIDDLGADSLGRVAGRCRFASARVSSCFFRGAGTGALACD